jgi:hypothetical protein
MKAISTMGDVVVTAIKTDERHRDGAKTVVRKNDEYEGIDHIEF